MKIQVATMFVAHESVDFKEPPFLSVFFKQHRNIFKKPISGHLFE